MNRYFTCRLYPTPSQEWRMRQYLDVTRRLYNFYLEQKKLFYRDNKTQLSRYDMVYDIADLREIMPSLADVSSTVLAEVTHRLDAAFRNFFARVRNGASRVGFPRFKSVLRWNSFGFFADGRYKCPARGGRLHIPKIVRGIRCRGLQRIEGKVGTVRVLFKAGRWFATISSRVEVAPAHKRMVVTRVGIDVGIKTFAALSNGDCIPNPRFGKQLDDCLNRAQKNTSRKIKGSTRRWRAIRKLQLLYLKASDRRSTWSHTQAKRIAERFDFVAVEDLDLLGMIRNRRYAKSVMDAAFGQFITRVGHKVESTGGTFVKVDPRGTTQECSGCGKIVPKTIAVRVHKCPYCGVELCRDRNAALNILHRGLELLHVSAGPPAEREGQGCLVATGPQ